MKAKVRTGTPRDASASWRIFRAHLNWINVWFSHEQVVQRQSSFEDFERLFEEAPSAVAETDGVIVGFAVGDRRTPLVLDIDNLYVDDPYRGRGTGTALLSHLEILAEQSDFQTMVATVSTYFYPGKPSAEGLYTRLGYDVVELNPGTHYFVKRLFDQLSPSQPKVA